MKKMTEITLVIAVNPFSTNGPPLQNREHIISWKGCPGAVEEQYCPVSDIFIATSATLQASESRPYPAERNGTRDNNTIIEITIILKIKGL